MANTAHFVFVGAPMWGHLRPQNALALNLLHRYPQLYITFVAHVASAKNLKSETTRFGASEEVLSRLKFKLVGEDETLTTWPAIFNTNAIIEEPLRPFVQDLSPNGTGFEKRPSAIVPDMFTFGVGTAVQKLLKGTSLPKIQVIVFAPTTPVSLMHMFSTAEDGGIFAKMGAEADRRIKENPKKYEEGGRAAALRDCWGFTSDNLIELPDSPPMYDYEYWGQLDAMPARMGDLTAMLETTGTGFRESDGIIFPVLPELYFEDMDRHFLKSFGVRSIQVGPQMAPSFWKGDFGSDATDSEPIQFLDQALEKFGKHSALFLSFGSQFFPSEKPDAVHAALDGFAQSDPPMPVLFAAAGAPPELFAQLKARAEKNPELLMLSPWVPQMSVLSHPATGWILTHGGSNTMSESIFTGVPTLYWGIAADQPLIAAKMSLHHKVGFELVQVRTSTSSVGRPTWRGITPLGTPEAITKEVKEIVARMRGPEGEERRSNMAKWSAIQRKSVFDPSGRSYKGLGEVEQLF